MISRVIEAGDKVCDARQFKPIEDLQAPLVIAHNASGPEHRQVAGYR